jgi:hypothetical protein
MKQLFGPVGIPAEREKVPGGSDAKKKRPDLPERGEPGRWKNA